ncbi:rho GTPase-activating protein 15 isoform X1 [Cyclopterus lumpus]|uniref:rho GTPase-activating protein 15 isoform X1 n=1 Tax=Cyclopterus lumpus TaxID=8103 RepID=UPI001485CEAD|nr:rho GTPase-activating protein 15 isoform X1 [Cyclopterus lumpus]
MAGARNLQSAAKQPPLIQPPARLSTAPQEAVLMRIKSSGSSAERLSQSKSMVLQESDLPKKPISRHRRNQSQHNASVAGGGVAVFEPLVELNGEHLNVAKISESGKKQRKNWTLMWSVLTSDQMLFYKERQQETSLKTGSKPDVLQLCGAIIEWTTEKSSRKNVFQIRTNTGSEYLIQADSYATASKWYDAIRKAVDSSTKLPLRRSNSTEYLPRHGSLPSHGSASPNAKQRNPVHRRSINMFGSSKLKHSASDSTDKNGVKNRLKKFITRRPSMRTLKEKGLIKDRVFGCHLLTLCEREGTTVPRFVHICLDAVDKRGLDADGIYRVSGNLATIQKLRFIVDQEEDLDLDQSQWEDIHVVTGALKLFFRELPEPLFPFRFFQPFVEAVKIKESKLKVQAMKKLIKELPQPNQDTMKLLFNHLHRVLHFSRKNLMSTQGIGIVFGPTLMWPELDAGNMAVNMVYQTQIVEFILIESQDIFNLDRK